MAKQRVINTKFWSDGFIRTKLNPLDRYMFLYFLTNERTNICGAYELPMEIVASEAGLDKEMIEKMIPRFEGKIYYVDNWVIMPNFIKHQTLNPSVKQGIAREYELLPINVQDRLYTDWVQLGLLNLTKLNLTKPNLSDSPKTKIVLNNLDEPERTNQIQQTVTTNAWLDQAWLEEMTGKWFDKLEENFSKAFIKQEIQKFLLYWSESSPGGKKMRFEKQEVFDPQRRLITWMSRALEDQSKYKNLTSNKYQTGEI